MSIRDLGVLYLLIGLPLGVLAYRRGAPGALGALVGTVLLWPLWAPFSVLAKAAPEGSAGRRSGAPATARAPGTNRLEEALAAVHEAAGNGALPPAFLDKVRAAAARLSGRVEELDAALLASRERLSLAAGAPGPGAEVQRRTAARLERLRDESVTALTGLEGLLSALAASLLLARFEAPSADDLDDLVAQLKAHLELLGETFPSPPAG